MKTADAAVDAILDPFTRGWSRSLRYLPKFLSDSPLLQMTKGAKRRWTKRQLRRKMREGERGLGREDDGRKNVLVMRVEDARWHRNAKTPETGLNSITENQTSSLACPTAPIILM